MHIFRSPRTTPRICFRGLLVSVCFFALSLSVFAKDSSLTAIILFDSPDGAKYLQASGVSLNGKTELRVCDGAPKFDKHGYDAMPRVQLAAGSALDRKADGTLTLASFDATTGAPGAAVCILPNGIKFDKSPEMTPAQAADQAMLTLALQTAPPTELPLLKPGMQIVFVPAPDAELADYLRARRAHSINVWQDYLKHYPAAPHTAQARQEIAGELEQSAETLLAQYSRSSGSATPQLGLLKQVRATVAQIESVTGNRAAAQKVWQQLHENLDTLIARGRRELQAFTTAQADHTAGYAHLESAKNLSAEILEITPAYPAAVAFHNDLESAEAQVNSTLQSAEGMLMAKRYDDALHSVDPYRGMAAELPRVAGVIDTVYKAHMARAQALAGQGNWDQAATEYRAAVGAKPESAEAATAMKNAEAQYAEIFNRRVVEQALADSRNAAQKGDTITAYEVLADLPAQQRAQVAARMESLKRDYVTSASKQALKLQEVHLPIRGRADEKAVCQAWDLLQHASTLSNDPALKLKLDLLSEKLGAYYLDQARRYLQRPLGSGAGLGWLYLSEAQRYQPDLDAVKDAMARYQPAYQLRGRLSIGVVVRDQTSRRDNPGFADQLGDAIANALESSGQPVKVVRRYSEDADKVQPDFVLVAEILQHRLVKNSNLETLPSKYRAGTHEVKNEKWTAANDALNQAQQELVQAQRALADAQQRRVKPDIKTASDNVAAVQQKIDALRKQLESTEQTRAEGVVEPYNYTRRTIDLAATVELAFRLSDDAGAVIDSNPSVKREDHKSAVILENVKPEDTQGVTAINTPPDEVQFLTDLELQTRDALLKSIKDKAAHLPQRVLEQARQRSQQQDLEGAAADYIVFLNATSDNRSPERNEAETFLRDHFNIAVPAQTAVRQAQARQPGQ